MKDVKIISRLFDSTGAPPTAFRWISSFPRRLCETGVLLQKLGPETTHFADSCQQSVSFDAGDSVRPNQPEGVLSHFFEVGRRGVPIDELQLICAIKSCSALQAVDEGRQIHSIVSKAGFETNIYIRNGLMNFYAKCGMMDIAHRIFESGFPLDFASWNTMICGYVKLGRVEDARVLFDKMPERDCVSWTTMIMGLDQNGDPAGAISMFRQMWTDKIMPNEVTLASFLSACSRIGAVCHGRTVHATIIKLGFEFQLLVSTNLINMYVKFSSLNDAKRLFNMTPSSNVVTLNIMLNGYVKLGDMDVAENFFMNMLRKDVVSWSVLIEGYLHVGQIRKALLFYCRMQRSCPKPNEATTTNLLSACGDSHFLFEGRQLHGFIIKTGIDSHDFVHTTIIHMYASCGWIDLAHQQFICSPHHNISSSNALIAGYVKNNMIDEARQLFDSMLHKDCVSWSSMISGYAQNGQYEAALQLFYDMYRIGVKPNEITLVSVLSAISNSSALQHGIWIHDYIHRNSIPLNDKLSAGLIDMYAKCGNINNALDLFCYIRNKCASISPWNAIINGLAMHGYASESLSIFSDLQKTEIVPNSITFIGVLSACCHAGKVELGEWYFYCLMKQYKIEPNIKHYGCMADLLGRAGRLEDAENLINSMPMQADVVIWGTLLASCRIHGNVCMAERVAKCLVDLQPDHGGGRVLLSNVYADEGRWNDVLETRRAIQRTGVKKMAGRSGVI